MRHAAHTVHWSQTAKKAAAIGLGLFCALGAELNLLIDTQSESTIGRVFSALGGYDLAALVLFAALSYLFYKLLTGKISAAPLGYAVLSLGFSFCILLGMSFENYDSLILLNGSWLQILKCTAAGAAYTLMVYLGISAFLTWMETLQKNRRPMEKQGFLQKLFEEHPFRTPFLIFVVVWAPFFLANYPGLMMGDTVSQTLMALNMENKFANQVDRPNPDIWLTYHHPLAHTGLIALGLRVSSLLGGSDTFGYFLYTLVQYLFQAGILAYGMSFMQKKQISIPLRTGVFLFYLLHPVVVVMGILGTKDTIFSAFFLMFYIHFADMIRDPEKYRQDKKQFVLFAVSVLGCYLFRKNAFHVLLLCIPFLILLCRRMRVRLTALLLALVLFNSLFFKALDAFEISPGTPRATYSLLFQQTARYVKEYPEEVTPEEKDAINAVLRYDKLARLYDPTSSDPVKATWRRTNDSETIGNYLKVWFQMFFKHPGVYFQAFFNHTYGSYCLSMQVPDSFNYRASTSRSQQERLMNEGGIEIAHPKALHKVQDLFQGLQRLALQMPIFSVLYQAATFFWIPLLFMVMLLYRRKYRELFWYVPVMVTFLMSLVSPINASRYFRYVYPNVLIVPLAVAITVQVLLAGRSGDAKKALPSNGGENKGLDKRSQKENNE